MGSSRAAIKLEVWLNSRDNDRNVYCCAVVICTQSRNGVEVFIADNSVTGSSTAALYTA